jgi:hypothetical protein
MAIPLKRVFFLLCCAFALLRASPALSVPLASAIDHPGVVNSGTQPNGQYGPFRQVGGGSEGTEAEARIVGSEQLAYGPSSDKAEVSGPHSEYGMSGSAVSMGNGGSKSNWFKPAAAVGAGGAALYALFGTGKNGNAGAGNGGGISSTSSANLGGTPGGGPSDVPEPGTIMMLGIGIASFLGRRKLGFK